MNSALGPEEVFNHWNGDQVEGGSSAEPRESSCYQLEKRKGKRARSQKRAPWLRVEGTWSVEPSWEPG